MSSTNPITCSICGAQYRRPAPDSCMRCGARSSEHVRWWNSLGQCIDPERAKRPSVLAQRREPKVSLAEITAAFERAREEL